MLLVYHTHQTQGQVNHFYASFCSLITDNKSRQTTDRGESFILTFRVTPSSQYPPPLTWSPSPWQAGGGKACNLVWRLTSNPRPYPPSPGGDTSFLRKEAIALRHASFLSFEVSSCFGRVGEFVFFFFLSFFLFFLSLSSLSTYSTTAIRQHGF